MREIIRAHRFRTADGRNIGTALPACISLGYTGINAQ
jgi:hypothetical protein